jgi:hypothetical protein
MRRLTALALLALVGLVACSPPSAQDLVRQVVQQRNNYEARLTSWIVREDAPTPHLYLDVMIINNNDEVALKTLTVMVEQLDAEDGVLHSQRVAVDVAQLTAGIGQGVGVQVLPVATGVEGIRLYVETNPESAVWPEFPEFNAVRPRI